MTVKFRHLMAYVTVIVIFMGIVLSILNGISAQVKNSSKSKPTTTVEKFKGLCYGPHRDNEDPDFGIQPTRSELAEDIAFIKNLTSTIRTYGITDNLEQIPLLCDSIGIDCYPGAWISRFDCENERQIDSLISIANLNLNHVKGLIVGNEVLLRNDILEEKLIEFITRAKNKTNLPIATAETWKDWLDHPQLVDAVDIMFVHVYPYWDHIAVEEGADYILEKWNELKEQYPEKTMVIGETGWPSKGESRGSAIPGEVNQKKYLTDFLSMAESNDIDYFYFEIFDEKWKSKFEGEAGSNWGMYLSNGSLKQHLTDLIPEDGRNGINRPPGAVDSTMATLPLYVYSDGCDSRNSFQPSGWMGELSNLAEYDSTYKDPTEILDELSTEITPYSGETCIRISYKSSIDQWGGIYWQFPVNNWGTYPGYDISKSLGENSIVKFSFWARGKEGGEKAEFKTGGIKDNTLPYKDSYGPISLPNNPITLTKEWKQYSLDLSDQDLSMIIGGFVWVTNYNQNPQGSTIYLDEILFEITNPISISDETYSPPSKFFLAQNYPNPFNPSTTIQYELREKAKIDISIYNVAGQKIVKLLRQSQSAGNCKVKWNGFDSYGQPVSNGIYIYRLTVNNILIDSKKMILLK